MKRRSFAFGMLVLVFLSGCTTALGQQNIQITQTLHSETSTKEVIPSLPTERSKTLEAMQVTTTSELHDSFKIETLCPDVDNEESELPTLVGTLVFAGEKRLVKGKILLPESGKDSVLSFWDAQSDKTFFYNLVEEEECYIYAESPDKERIAITEAKSIEMPYDLTILNNRAEEYERISFPDEWTFFNWLNNEQVLFRQYRTTKDITKEEYDLVAINIANQEQQFLSSELPNIYLEIIYWSWGAPMSFNPDGTIVMYHEHDYDIYQDYSIFWDLEKNKLIVRTTADDWARWSPDGRLMLLVVDVNEDVVEVNREIFLFNELTGEITQISFFKEHYEELFIYSPVWSPDNRFIAFWMKADRLADTANLAVLDTETLTVKIFHYEIAPWPYRFGVIERLLFQEIQVNSTSPIWSPDSQYLLIEDYEKGKSDTLLVDLQNHEIIKIADQARPVAWLK